MTTAFLLALLAAPPERTIAREPAYRSKSPAYCLLLFGPEARTRVCLVLDGEDLVIDLNADGDLTGAGERVACKSRDKLPGGATRYYYQAGPITEADGKTQHPELVVAVDREADSRLSLFTASVNVRGRHGELFLRPPGGTPLGDRPATAPAVHLGGPLVLAGSRTAPTTDFTRGGSNELRVDVVTRPAAGALGAAVLEATVPKDVHPVADIEFPHKLAEAPPLKVRVVLDRRCCGTRFYAPVPVPEDAGAGTARVSLTFPGWKEGKVGPATLTIPVK